MIKEFQKEYRWLSNFAPVRIELNGGVYSSVEHAYMSAKSDDPEWKIFCQNQKNSPGDVKRAGRKVTLASDWEERKIGVMRECVQRKFNQEPYKSLLLATGGEYIQEGNTWGDKFWGVDLRSNTGLNNLGKLIMEHRETLLKTIL